MGRYSSDLTVLEKLEIGVVAIIIGGAVLKGCAKFSGNYDSVDSEKQFNIAVDVIGDNVSITSIESYSDYSGVQFQFTTFDGLIILTSSRDTHFLKDNELEYVNEYAKMLVNKDDPKIVSYDELQGNDIEMYAGWNKDFYELTYTFDHAIMETEDGNVVITELLSWRDYSEDDKIQLTFSNGLVVLRDMDKVKLVNSVNAPEGSLYNYALSLVGDEEKIKYYPEEKTLKKTSLLM